jgi:hypothetical protein
MNEEDRYYERKINIFWFIGGAFLGLYLSFVFLNSQKGMNFVNKIPNYNEKIYFP